MPVTTELQTQISAIKARIDSLAPNATAEDIVMLAKGVEAVAGQATVFEIIALGDDKKAEITTLGETKKTEITTLTDTKKAEIVTQGNAKKAELQATLEQVAPFTGATATADGALGMVKKPVAGEQDYLLKGSGVWKASGEVPIGGITLMNAAVASTLGNFLRADGSIVLKADYPELFDKMGSYLGYSFSGDSNEWNTSIGYSTGYNGIVVNGNRVVMVGSGTAIRYSSNGGNSFAEVAINSKSGSGNTPCMSDEGTAIGWLYYDSGATPAHIRAQFATGPFGSANSAVNGSQFTTDWNQIYSVGITGGIAFFGNLVTTFDATFNYIANNAGSVTRTVTLKNIDPRYLRARGMARIGGDIYLLVDDNAGGAGEKFILRSANQGASWTAIHTSTGNWPGQNPARTYQADRRLNGDWFYEVGQGMLGAPVGIVCTATNPMIRINAAGVASTFTLPAGSGSILTSYVDYYNGEYIVPCANGIYATADFVTWTTKATASQLTLGKFTTISQAFMCPTNSAFMVRAGTGVNSRLYWVTDNFTKFKEIHIPSRLRAQMHATTPIYIVPGKELFRVVMQMTSAGWYGAFFFDMVNGHLGSDGMYQNIGGGSNITVGASLPMPGSDTDGYYSQFWSSNNQNNFVRYSNRFSGFNRTTELRLPVSSVSGIFPFVGNYGEQHAGYTDSSYSNYSGYEYFVRVK